MYKFERYRQLGPANFNQPVGFKMDPENRWVKKSETIPWDTIEEKYAKLKLQNNYLKAENELLKKGYLMKGDGTIVIFKK